MKLIAIVSIAIASVIGFAGPVAAKTSSTAGTSKASKAKLLSLSDLGAGWSIDHTTSGDNALLKNHCLATFRAAPARVLVSFSDHGTAGMGEVLVTGPGEAHRWSQAKAALAGCRSIAATVHGLTVHFTVGSMSFPAVGNASAAYRMTVEDLPIAYDLVIFRASAYIGLVTYASGTPSITTTEAVVKKAVTKVEGKSAS